MAVKTETPNDTKSTDRIEKRVVFRAPRTRVWRALTNAEEFGTWFRVKLESPFTEGKPVRGRLSIPGYERSEERRVGKERRSAWESTEERRNGDKKDDCIKQHIE